jgi:hypothetical protein
VRALPRSLSRAVLLWFVGTSVLAVWYVFRDPRFDYRWVVVGARAPDPIDALTGGAGVLHSVTGAVAVLVVVMLATIGRRALRKRLLGVPIGLFLHLVFDGAFSNTTVFWWPFSGGTFDHDGTRSRLPIAERGAWNAVLEVAGLAMAAWIWRRFGLRDRARRRQLLRTGQLVPVARPR